MWCGVEAANVPDYGSLTATFWSVIYQENEISFQGESRLTGTLAFITEGTNVTATFFTNKSSCQIVKNGSTLSDLSGGEDSIRCYGIEITTGATCLDIKTWGGSGDCDLDVIYYRPDFDDHASCNLGNQEEITLAVPHSGRWYVFLYGYSSYSGLNLNVSYVIQVPPRSTPMPWIPLLLNDE